MKNQYTKYYIAIFYLCSTVTLFAQPGSDNDNSNLEGTDVPAPIDNYIWVLALLGLLFIFIKLMDVVKHKDNF